jgi:hypothetical protein
VKDFEISLDAYRAAGAEIIELTPEEMEKFRAATQAMLPVQEAMAQQAGLQNTGALVKEYYRIAATVPFRE